MALAATNAWYIVPGTLVRWLTTHQDRNMWNGTVSRPRPSYRLGVGCAVLGGLLGCSSTRDFSIGWQDLGASPSDSGVTDSEVSDARVSDSGVGDSRISDAGSSDSGVGDARVGDSGVADSGPGDSGLGDSLDSGTTGRFTLIWRDDFQTLDPGRWEAAVHTFEENLGDFSSGNAFVEGGFLKLAVRVKPSGSADKPYSAAELRTWATFSCGKFVVRARIAAGLGLATTFFGFHDFYLLGGPQNWNDIVLEASAPSTVDYVYTLLNSSLPGSKERVPSRDTVPFDMTAGFHTYGFEWTPTEVRFLVDDVVEQSLAPDVVQRLNRPKRIVMSAYPSTRLVSGRSFDPAVLPSEAQYDWIEVYRYDGPCPGSLDGGGAETGARDGAPE